MQQEQQREQEKQDSEPQQEQEQEQEQQEQEQEYCGRRRRTSRKLDTTAKSGQKCTVFCLQLLENDLTSIVLSI